MTNNRQPNHQWLFANHFRYAAGGFTQVDLPYYA
jgi:hypothetical protein